MEGSKQERLEALRSAVLADPGAEEFVELANLLAPEREHRPEAREVCLRGLTENPKNYRGRVTLARLYYLDGYGEFCIRELAELRKRVSLPSLERLIELFGSFAKPFMENESKATPAARPAAAKDNEPAVEIQPADSVFAEMDIDDEFLEALEELEDAK